MKKYLSTSDVQFDDWSIKQLIFETRIIGQTF